MKKQLTLRSIDLITGLDADGSGVPFRWLAALVDKVKAQVPDDEEATCMVHNAAGLTFSYTHTLTLQEELEAELDSLRAKADQVRALLPREGALTAEQTEALRELLK